MSYCTRQAVTDRLSSIGILNLVDDDDDGVLDAGEGTLVDDVITSVSAEIDMYLTPVIETVPVSSSNQWLSDRCVDLACERLAGRRGRKPPVGVTERATLSRGWLDKVAAKTLRVPGLTYPGDGYTEENRRIGRPVVGNPGRGAIYAYANRRY